MKPVGSSSRRRQRRRLSAAYFVVVLVFALLFTLFPGKPAQAGSQFLWWSDEGLSTTTIGPNGAIIIWSGKMEYVAACLGGGTPDFIYPWTDIYIVPAGSVAPFGELEDVGGTPNTVQSLGTSGIFMDELIGQAAPGGKIPPGVYDIIYDECQDGTYDLQDVRFPNALTITAPTTNVPALPNMSHGKAEAETHYKRLEKFEKIIDKLFKKGGKYDKGGTTYGYGKFKFVSVVTDPRQGAMIQLGNLAKHYKGIAADPPDPAFQQVTQLAQRAIIDFESDDPLDQAIANYLTAASNEAAIAEAYLHSLERYQGADAANDGSWALLHAFAIQDHLNQLAIQLNRSNAALVALGNALAADPRPLDAIGDEFKAFHDRIATAGFSADELLDMRNSGWDDAKVEQFRQWILIQDFLINGDDRIAEYIAEINGQIAENNSHITALENYWNAMVPVINQLQNDATVTFDFPLAHAGGPYTGNEGSPISFSGSGSLSASPIVSYEWDFDNDGLFDDATGVSPSFTFNRAFRGLIGLKVTNDAGKSNVAWTPLTVNSTNQAPQVSAYAPTPLGVTVAVGDTQPFAVTVTDPENDPVDISWELDGATVGSGSGFSFAPGAAQFGPHTVEAKIWDASPLGGTIRVRWDVEVLFPDDDNDGWRQNVECNDSDPTVNPGRPEIPGNGKDDDCDAATPDAPPVVVQAAGNQTAQEGVAASFALGAFTDTNADEPYLIDVDWGDTSAHSSLTAMAPGIIGPEMHTYADSGSYTVTITVTDSTGGSDTGTFHVNVANANPTAVLTAPAAVNVGDSFTLALTGAADPSGADTAAGFTYAFDCGAGYGPFGPSATANCTAAGAGAVTVRAQIRDKDGGASAYTATVQVNGPVSVTAPMPQMAAEGAAVTLDLGAFGDGGPDGPWTVVVDWGDASAPATFQMAAPGAIAPQAHTYADSGAYSVTVTVTDAGGQSDSASFTLSVANLPPAATLTAPASAVTGQALAISLNNAADPSTVDAAAGFTYAFDCGTGYGPYDASASASCTAVGTGAQIVKAKLKDKDGAEAEYTATVQISAQTYPPVALFSPGGSGRNVALKEIGAVLHSSSGQYNTGYPADTLIDGNITNSYWATPNGQKTGWVKIDLMGNAWMIDRVQVRPSNNATERVADFSIAVSTTGTLDTDFTTVLTATAANNNNLQEFVLPQPVLAKYVKYSVMTNRGSACCTGTQQLRILTGQQGGAAVTFQNLSTDPDGDIVSYLWDFGDGATSTESSPSHTYAAPGLYPVTLTVTDSEGKTGSQTLEYRYLAPPAASFTINPASGAREGASLAFNDTSTDPDGGVIMTRVWKWGDNTQDLSSTASNASHAFGDNNTYTITLTVTDDQGQTAEAQRTYTTLNANPSVGVGASQTTPWGVPIQPYTPNVSDPGSADVASLQCRWNFGDGTSHGPGLCSDNNYKLPAHAWANPGVYQRNLTVTDKDGGSATSTNVQVTVIKRNAGVGYHGQRTFSAGTVTLGARLRDQTQPGPIAGRTVTFTVNGQTQTAVTGADGVATISLNIGTPGVYPVELDFAGDAYYNPAARDHDRIWVGVADDSLVTANGSLASAEMTCLALNTVNLQVTGTNPTTASVPLDIALVIDVSGSMGGANIVAAKAAARSFVQIVDRESDGVQDGLIRGSRIAVIPFHGEASVGRYLSSNAADLDAYINTLQAGGGTAIDQGIIFGQAELVNGAKLGNKPVMILLSDGGSNRQWAYNAADAAKAAGTELFSIALGTGADVTLMQNVASDPKATHYFFSPGTTQLEQIYQTIADSATGPAATNVVVTVQVDPAFTVVAGSVTPAPSSVVGNTITWTIPELKGETKNFAYQVQHAGPGGGPHTVNSLATITYTDTRGNSRTLPFAALTALVTCQAALSYTGALEGIQGQQADLKAQLAAQHSGMALANQNLTFDLGGLTAAGQTTAAGQAHTALLLSLPPGTYPLTVQFAGAPGYPPATATVQFVVTPAGPCDPLVWRAPLSATGMANVSLGAPLPIRFVYDGCGSFVHDESVLMVLADRATGQEIAAWVYGSDITIDDAAEEYRVTFTPSLYPLTAGQELEIQVYIGGQLVGRATLRMVP